MQIELLPFRAWIGIWTFVIATICVAVEGSVLVRHFTRFTEEIFALLISIIFIYETASGLKYVRIILTQSSQENPHMHEQAIQGGPEITEQSIQSIFRTLL